MNQQALTDLTSRLTEGARKSATERMAEYQALVRDCGCPTPQVCGGPYCPRKQP